MMILDNVFIPNERIFMDGEVEFASMLVERFTCYHRRSYVCKTGLGDVLIGAAASIADYNGVSNASHIKDKLVEMTHLNETIFALVLHRHIKHIKCRQEIIKMMTCWLTYVNTM